MRQNNLCRLSLVSAIFIAVLAIQGHAQDKADLRSFDVALEALGQRLHIPGLSVAVVKGDSIVFAKGYGYADLVQLNQASPYSCYKIASLTKPVTAFLLHLYQQKGMLSLGDKAMDYSIDFGQSGKLRLYHLLSHTSEKDPGKRFHYNGYRFGALDSVFRQVAGRSFQEAAKHDLAVPYRLNSLISGPGLTGWQLALSDSSLGLNSSLLAAHYQVESDGSARESSYPSGFSPAAGLISNVVDYAEFLIIQDSILDENSQRTLYTAVESRTGQYIPYGLGWFVQEIEGQHIAWHYGWNPPGVSGLVIQDLHSGLKMVVMANSDRLSKPYGLETGNLLRSPVSHLFFEHLVFSDSLPDTIIQAQIEVDKITAKATGETPPIPFLMRLALGIIFLCLLSGVVLWPLAWLVRKPWRRKSRQLFKTIRYGGFFTFSRYYALLLIICAFLINSMIVRQSALVYWTHFPGFFAGVPVYENIFLALPSLLSLLMIVEVFLVARIWLGKFGTLRWRIQYTVVFAALLGYLAILWSWNLIDPVYYLSWLL